MRTQVILSILLIITLVPVLISASDYSYPRGNEIDLKIPCIFEDVAYCDNQATCNITINYPNGNNLVNDQPMTYNAAYFNYTLNENQTQVVGLYPTTIVCEDQGAAGTQTFNFEITSTGAKDEYIFNIIFFVFILLSIILMIFGFSKDNTVLVFLSGIMIVVGGVWMFYNQLVYLPSVVNTVLCYVLWGFGGYLILISSVKALREGF